MHNYKGVINPNKMNQLYPKLGEIEGKPLLRWDPATRCSDYCVIYEECPYIKKGRCSLETTYMNTIYRSIISPDPEKGVAELMSDFEVQRVGLHLMPLYQQLVKMKKVAHAVDEMVVSDKKGSVKMHPVFAEIRTVIRDIAKEMKDLKLEEKWKQKFGTLKGVGAGASIEELFDKGAPGAYDEISK